MVSARSLARGAGARSVATWIVAALCVLLGACASVRLDGQYPPSQAMLADPAAQLSRIGADVQGTLSALRVLDTGADAFLERAALIEAAQHSIDAQYYIWNSDLSGRYLALRLLMAAERGVRVRLLIDDINVAGRDAALASLDAHPNIELRIYNPFAERRGMRRLANFLYEFSRLNRRMHNKSFTVDGVVTIIGGRNIGDEYFDADPELNFRDRDVVASGPVAVQAGAMFDQFWNSELSVPALALSEARVELSESTQWQTASLALQAELQSLGFQPPGDAAAALRMLRESRSRQRLVDATLVHDEPPGLDTAADTDQAQRVAATLVELAQASTVSILAETAYLVMDEPSLAVMAAKRDSGVVVRMLTNSLASNDVTANHAAYARRRPDLLLSGIALHELRPDADYCASVIARLGCSEGRVLGLHAKTVVFDHHTVAIGSINLNMRSAYLNAEALMIIRSPELAREVSAAIETGMQAVNSWSVRQEGNALLWQTTRAGTLLSSDKEPDSGWWRRLRSSFVASLPLEKYL